MAYKMLGVRDLLVNHDNDRHGMLASENEALKWLLTNRTEHMRRLAADIVDTGVVFEPPLVRQEDDSWIVYDGNRRVASLKLLLDPTRAPTPDWRRFYEQLAAIPTKSFPEQIECRLEDDIDLIDELLFRRHTGSQGGVGQSPWDSTAKHNFIERTGRGRSINLARDLFSASVRNGYARPLWQIPLSNMNRLLSGESQRNQLGLSLKKDIIYFTHEPGVALRALARVMDDLSTKVIVLSDVWDADSKNRYLAELCVSGVTPSAKFALRKPIPLADWLNGIDDEEAGEGDQAETGPDTQPESEAERDAEHLSPPARRVHLIPDGIDYSLPKKPDLVRIQAIWEELQRRLYLAKHVNAISVLFRVLLELSLSHYLNKVGETTLSGAGWADKFKAAIRLQLERGHIDNDYADILRRFQRHEELISSASMNKFVHNVDLSPSPQHLTSLWDTLQRFILVCLEGN